MLSFDILSQIDNGQHYECLHQLCVTVVNSCESRLMFSIGFYILFIHNIEVGGYREMNNIH